MQSNTFPPYQAYQQLISQIDDFAYLSECSYGLAQQLLFKFPKDTLRPSISMKPTSKQLSFGMGDQKIKQVELDCEWVTFEKYAELSQNSVENVFLFANNGELGPVRDDSEGVKRLLWPPKYHHMDESKWPEIGEKTYKVSFTVTAKASLATDPSDLNSFDEIQHEYLRSAHALGEPAKVAERAAELLNRSLFLLEWTAFEVFLRSTVQELIRRHPHILAYGKRGKDTVSLEEIINLSEGLSDITLLRENLAIREIERQVQGGESVHGLLNLLKSQFKFKSDPYNAWYIIKGVRRSTSYLELMEFKDTRNVLVHDAGRASDEFQNSYPTVPIRDGMVVIEDEFYLRASLALRSVGYLVSKTISSDNYVV